MSISGNQFLVIKERALQELEWNAEEYIPMWIVVEDTPALYRLSQFVCRRVDPAVRGWVMENPCGRVQIVESLHELQLPDGFPSHRVLRYAWSEANYYTASFFRRVNGHWVLIHGRLPDLELTYLTDLGSVTDV